VVPLLTSRIPKHASAEWKGCWRYHYWWGCYECVSQKGVCCTLSSIYASTYMCIPIVYSSVFMNVQSLRVPTCNVLICSVCVYVYTVNVWVCGFVVLCVLCACVFVSVSRGGGCACAC